MKILFFLQAFSFPISFAVFAQTMEETLALISTQQDVEAHLDKKVQLVGVYEQMNVAKRPQKTIYAGRALIRLADASVIAIEREEKGYRSEDEIRRFEQKKSAPRWYIAAAHSPLGQ
ncbi:MAG: hypothetical protein HC913_11760 [Microscillaceae bacterium]|nr:hypothetical protein [Microscillaceae bacterium]